jgi:deoxyribonuclease V
VIACVDVDYRADRVVTARVDLRAFTDETADHEHVIVSSEAPAKYKPGSFYQRELPYLLEILSPLPDIVIVDAHVWLAGDDPGLGARLFDRIECPVIGVAKQPFRDQTRAIPILRGVSKQPLIITAVGIDVAEAAANVRSMHGPHRLPTLIKRADTLARATESVALRNS